MTIQRNLTWQFLQFESVDGGGLLVVTAQFCSYYVSLGQVLGGRLHKCFSDFTRHTEQFQFPQNVTRKKEKPVRNTNFRRKVEGELHISAADEHGI